MLREFSSFIRQFLKKPSRDELAPGIGRAEWQELTWGGGSQDRTEQNEGLRYYADLLKNPDIFAGIRQRASSVARLWVSAAGLEPDDEDAYYPAQLLPYSSDSHDMEIWDFVADVLDNQLEHGFRQVIENVQQARLTYGRAVQELDWQVKDNRVTLRHIWDRDPERFFILTSGNCEPLGLLPGVYLKKHVYDSITTSTRMPDRKFWIITKNSRFENPYGVPETNPLIDAEFGLRNVYRFFARHLERHGSPLINAMYPKELESNETWQAAQLAALKHLSSQSITLHSERVQIEALEGAGEISGFLGYIEQRKAEISTVLTGSPSALKESQYGTYGQSESKDKGAKGMFEQDDAASFCESLNFNPLVWLVDYNFSDVKGYPFLQLIAPERITPTLPKEQAQPQQAQIEIDTEDSAAMQAAKDVVGKINDSESPKTAIPAQNTEEYD